MAPAACRPDDARAVARRPPEKRVASSHNRLRHVSSMGPLALALHTASMIGPGQIDRDECAYAVCRPPRSLRLTRIPCVTVWPATRTVTTLTRLCTSLRRRFPRVAACGKPRSASLRRSTPIHGCGKAMPGFFSAPSQVLTSAALVGATRTGDPVDAPPQLCR